MHSLPEKGPEELLAELSKKAGEEAGYLDKDREYRCEDNVFEDYTQEERDAVFGKPPATVWDNVKIMKSQSGQSRCAHQERCDL